MIRDLFSIVLGVALALALGIYSAVKATEGLPPLGKLQIGAWIAHPSVGGNKPDPYTQAWLSRSGSLPLAAAEGLQFTAENDGTGRALDASCTYSIAGDSPAARRWTLYILRGGIPFTIDTPGIPFTLHSRGVVRSANGSFHISVAPAPQPGNWIYAGPDGPFVLSLTLYDTTIASDTGLSEITMPTVKRERCGDA
jgi:hypothetical protein